MPDGSEIKVLFGASTDGLKRGAEDAAEIVGDLGKKLAELGKIDVATSLVPKPGAMAAAGAEFLALQNDVLAAAASLAKLNSAAGKREAQQQMQAEIAAIRSKMRLEDVTYAGEVQHINALARIGEITEAQKTQNLRAALEARWKEQQQNFQRELAATAAFADRHNKILGELRIAEQRHANEVQRMQDQARLATVQRWETGLHAIEAAWNSQLRGLLSGTTNFAQAMRNIFQQLAIQIIEYFEGLLVKKLALALASMFGDPTEIAARTKSIVADMGQAYAGFVAFYAPILGPGAPAAAAAQTAAAQSVAFGMASLDVGAWSLPADMMALVHRGEMVIPAQPAQAFRDMLTGAPARDAGGAGPNVTFQVHAMDSASVAQFFRQNAQHLAKAVAAYMNSNASARPSY